MLCVQKKQPRQGFSFLFQPTWAKNLSTDLSLSSWLSALWQTDYGYRTLHCSRSEIRLIKLRPKDGSEKLKFIPACHIFHASPWTKPKFIALSYIWGDAADLRLILVENPPVLVINNLYDAMMALRLHKEHNIMWIESLCIYPFRQGDSCRRKWRCLSQLFLS